MAKLELRDLSTRLDCYNLARDVCTNLEAIINDDLGSEAKLTFEQKDVDSVAALIKRHIEEVGKCQK